MNVHKNARMTPKGREAIADAARRHYTTSKTTSKWVKRYRKHGVEGLHDRSSRPHSMPSQTPLATRNMIEALRQHSPSTRMTSSSQPRALARGNSRSAL